MGECPATEMESWGKGRKGGEWHPRASRDSPQTNFDPPTWRSDQFFRPGTNGNRQGCGCLLLVLCKQCGPSSGKYKTGLLHCTMRPAIDTLLGRRISFYWVGPLVHTLPGLSGVGQGVPFVQTELPVRNRRLPFILSQASLPATAPSPNSQVPPSQPPSLPLLVPSPSLHSTAREGEATSIRAG